MLRVVRELVDSSGVKMGSSVRDGFVGGCPFQVDLFAYDDVYSVPYPGFGVDGLTKDWSGPLASLEAKTKSK